VSILWDVIIFWFGCLSAAYNIVSLLGNGREISNYTTAVFSQRLRKQTRTQKLHSNRETAFSLRSFPRCYKQDNLGVGWWVSELVRETLRFSHREMLLLEAGSWGQGQFGKPEEWEHPPLKADTKQRLVKTVTDWEDLVYPILIREVFGTVRANALFVVTSCRSSVNPITNSHAHTRDNIKDSVYDCLFVSVLRGR
jgi:hypothetical protein